MRPPPLRTIALSASAAVVAAAAAVVPMPYVEYRPGTAVAIAPLIEVSGVEVTELDGTASLLTIMLRQQPLGPLIVALIDDERTLLPTSRVYPRGVDRRTYLADERERFDQQFEAAAAVGARTAGQPVELVTEVVVVEVVPGSPADGVLAPGDVLIAIDGVTVTSSEQVQAIVRARRAGARLALTIEHAGEVRPVTVVLADLDGSGQGRIGILAQTAIDRLRVPFDIALTDGVRIGGPSAGMMIGLTVYDLLSEEDLLAGRSVVGTGTLDVDGRVGPVGGVPQKVRAGIEAGADVVIVPRSQLDEALGAAEGEVVVIGVETLDEAIQALRDLAG